MFPGIRVDISHKVVEFDGEIAIEAHHPQTPRVYLEVLVCTPDTREHESIVVTRAKPSLVHAALLACGLTEGRPGSWDWDETTKTLRAIPPTGDPLRVDLIVDGASRCLADYALRADSRVSLSAPHPLPSSFVFAGSTLRSRGGIERYEADGAGTLVGLTAFGTETIAWSHMYSPDASLEDPVWIANSALLPPRGTKVQVRISPLSSPR